ncbi:hypothetical protein Taro_030108 [Colocasia esculenta]|uniref:Uncharacterized protein n=1 Tax=Colocasia esculenta TaxID=4460 RepID=A0A843VZ93_COLES|nr:hypothetical protein [Colocasia esculenta]
MEQYLEEKKASQKRSAPPFQRQDRKKAAYQSPQCPVTASSQQEYSPPQGQYNAQHPNWSSSLSRARRQPTSFTCQEANLLVQTPMRFYYTQTPS